MTRKQMLKTYSIVLVLAIIGGSFGSFMTYQFLDTSKLREMTKITTPNTIFVEESMVVVSV